MAAIRAAPAKYLVDVAIAFAAQRPQHTCKISFVLPEAIHNALDFHDAFPTGHGDEVFEKSCKFRADHTPTNAFRDIEITTFRPRSRELQNFSTTLCVVTIPGGIVALPTAMYHTILSLINLPDFEAYDFDVDTDTPVKFATPDLRPGSRYGDRLPIMARMEGRPGRV
jgi:hypothetical protein